jgi:hypothetical protein
VVSPTHEHPQTDLQSDKPISATISWQNSITFLLVIVLVFLTTVESLTSMQGDRKSSVGNMWRRLPYIWRSTPGSKDDLHITNIQTISCCSCSVDTSHHYKPYRLQFPPSQFLWYQNLQEFEQ